MTIIRRASIIPPSNTCKLIDNLLKNPERSFDSSIISINVDMHEKIKLTINPMYASFFTMKNPPS